MWCQSWKRCYQWCQDASLRVLQQFSNATPNISGAHVQSWKHVWCSHLSVFAVVAMLCFILCEKRSVGSSRHFPRPPEISQHLWWTLLNYNGAHKTPRPLCECLCKICAISITALVNFELFTARFCSHLHPAHISIVYLVVWATTPASWECRHSPLRVSRTLAVI